MKYIAANDKVYFIDIDTDGQTRLCHVMRVICKLNVRAPFINFVDIDITDDHVKELEAIPNPQSILL